MPTVGEREDNEDDDLIDRCGRIGAVTDTPLAKAERAFVRTFAIGVVIGLLLTEACGGGGKGDDIRTDASSEIGVSADVGSNASTDTVVLTGACANLTCLGTASSLIASCAPSGDCTEQATVGGTSATYHLCFSNGVKVSRGSAPTAATGTLSQSMTVKKGDSVCYSFSLSADATGTNGTIIYANGSGATLVTEALNGSTTTITCPGGVPTVFDDSCGAALSGLTGITPGTGACTLGTCTF